MPPRLIEPRPILDALIAAVEREKARAVREGYAPDGVTLPMSWRDRLAREATDRRSLPRLRHVTRIDGLAVTYEHCATRPILTAHVAMPIRHYQIIIPD